MTSPAGVNAHLTYIKNFPLFISRMQALGPRLIVGYVDKDAYMDRVEALRESLPDTLVIGRVKNDHEGAYHLKPEAPGDMRDVIATPQDVVDRWGRLGKNGGLFNLMNEPNGHFDPNQPAEVEMMKRLVNWVVVALYDAKRKNIRLAGPNFGVQHPLTVNGEWHPIFDPMLRAFSEYRGFHLLTTHEYLPKKDRIGLIRAAIKRCTVSLHIPPPQFGITESGYDLDVREGNSKLNGYKSRGISGGDYARQIIGLAEEDYRDLLDDGTLLGFAPFCYGNSGGWEQYDVEEDKEFWETLLAWHYVPVVEKPITVITPPVNVSTEPKPSEAAPTSIPADIPVDKKPVENVPVTQPTMTNAATLAKLQALLLAVGSIEDELKAMIAAYGSPVS